ncbi:MAG: FMN-binding negative transcriptional regulator [Piscinibacter sp.]|nr:FMN-binding negative transcriptional regulator [Piscinibacter sp.]
MYLPRHFEETRTEVLHALMRSHPFGLLVTQGPAGLLANPLPWLVDAGPTPLGTLRGHVARANPVWREAPGEVLVVFQGPQAYVSPGWYPAKAEHGKVVPTWNYAMVQARGRLRAVEDPAWLHGLVSRLTARHEATQPKPWQVTDAPGDYIDRMLAAIVGLEVEITALTGKWKVSQNRGAADRDGVAQGLEALPDDDAQAMAALVREASGSP